MDLVVLVLMVIAFLGSFISQPLRLLKAVSIAYLAVNILGATFRLFREVHPIFIWLHKSTIILTLLLTGFYLVFTWYGNDRPKTNENENKEN